MIAFVVTFSMKNIIVFARNERQCKGYVKLRFGSKLFYVIALATEHQVNFIKKKDGGLYLACYTGGEK